MGTVEALHQLIDEITMRAEQLAPFTGLHPLTTDMLRGNIRSLAGGILAELAQESDDRLSAEACLTVMFGVHGDADPAAEWWQTPLGRLCARSFGRDGAEAVTYSVAAAMLGLARGSIGPMLQRGDLDRHPDGGVLLSSVMARLAR